MFHWRGAGVDRPETQHVDRVDRSERIVRMRCRHGQARRVIQRRCRALGDGTVVLHSDFREQFDAAAQVLVAEQDQASAFCFRRQDIEGSVVEQADADIAIGRAGRVDLGYAVDDKRTRESARRTEVHAAASRLVGRRQFRPVPH